jgi:hypothetical protein
MKLGRARPVAGAWVLTFVKGINSVYISDTATFQRKSASNHRAVLASLHMRQEGLVEELAH